MERQTSHRCRPWGKGFRDVNQEDGCKKERIEQMLCPEVRNRERNIYSFRPNPRKRSFRRLSHDLNSPTGLLPGLRRRSATAKILGSARLEERNRTHPSTHLIDFAMVVKRREE